MLILGTAIYYGGPGESKRTIGPAPTDSTGSAQPPIPSDDRNKPTPQEVRVEPNAASNENNADADAHTGSTPHSAGNSNGAQEAHSDEGGNVEEHRRP